MEMKQQQIASMSVESIVESITQAALEQTAKNVQDGFENIDQNASMIMIAFD